VIWALYELARNPDILAELHKEISNTAGLLDVLSLAQLKNMLFLDSIVQETMRMYSLVGVNSRVALKDYTLLTGGGLNGTSPIGILVGTFLGKLPFRYPLRIKKITLNLTLIVMGLDLVHRRPSTYGPDAYLFNPHRWDNNWKLDL
jgi:cytochrome P450